MNDISKYNLTTFEDGTHRILSGKVNQYVKLDENNLDEFYNEHFDMVSCESTYVKKSRLFEKVGDISPLWFDIKLEYSKDLEESHNVSQTINLIGPVLYESQKLIDEVFCKITQDHRELWSSVQEIKKENKKEKSIIFTYRFIFPYVKTKKSYVNKFRLTVIKRLSEKKISPCIALPLENDWSKLFVTYKNSYKELFSYKENIVTKFYTKQSQRDINMLKLKTIELSDMFIPDELNIKIDVDQYDENILSSLFSSIYYYKNSLSCIWDKSKEKEQESNISNIMDNISVTSKKVIKNINYAEKLFKIINKKRVDERNWYEMFIEIIYSVFNGDRQGIRFLSNIYDNMFKGTFPYFVTEKSHEKYIRKIYCSTVCKNSKRTINSLMFLARKDNPVEFSKFMMEKNEKVMKKSAMDLSDSTLVNAFYANFPDIFIYDNKQKVWYMFSREESKWLDNAECDITEHIRTDFRKLYKARYLHLSMLMTSNNLSEDKYSEYQKENKCIEKVIKHLGKKGNISSLLDLLKGRYKNRHMDDYLNENLNLTGCMNGVISIKGESVLFREAMPEDYISKHTGNYYDETLNWDSELIIMLEDWFKKKYPTDEEKHHFDKLISSFLMGGNRDKRVFAFTGTKGNNSKSQFVALLQAAFGELIGKFKPGHLIQNNKDTGNTPDCVRWEARGKRLMIADELPPNVKLSGAILKQESGDDDKEIRTNYKTPKVIRTSYKIILVANNLPQIDIIDEALESRLHYIDLKTLFLESSEVPKTEREQWEKRIFHRDEDFRNQVKELGSALLWYCVQKYPIYKKEGLGKPQFVLDANAKFTNSQKLVKFLKECTVKSQGSIVKKKELREKFIDWCRTYYGNHAIDTMDTLENYINSKWGEPTGDKWMNYSLINDEDEQLGQDNDNDQYMTPLNQIISMPQQNILNKEKDKNLKPYNHYMNDDYNIPNELTVPL